MNNQKVPRYSQQGVEKVREYYDVFLASEPGKYSSLEEFNARYEPVLSFIKKMDKRGVKILDIGCGTGMAAERLKDFGAVYGVDISPKSIEQARDRLDEAYVSLAEKLPFQNEIFDVIVCTEVIEHLLAPSEALSEFNRVLRSGGYLIISTPNPWYWQITINRIMTRLRRQKAGSGQIVENYLPPPRLRSMLKKRGFEIEEFRTAFFKPAFVWKVIRHASNNLGLYQICIAKKLEEASL